MSVFVFSPAEVRTLPVMGMRARFPINRVFCLGRNYPWAVQLAPQPFPAYFMKPADAVVPAAASLAYPAYTREFCPEIELLVALGVGGSNIPPERALAHVWAYGVGLDMTRRDLQAQAKRDGQPWEAAKAFDASAPCTALVPVAAIGHPERGAIWLRVNGALRQSADLGEQLWSVPQVISRLSAQVCLKPGDLIFTGTPDGVAPVLPGDVLQGGIEGIAEFGLSIEKR